MIRGSLLGLISEQLPAAGVYEYDRTLERWNVSLSSHWGSTEFLAAVIAWGAEGTGAITRGIDALSHLRGVGLYPRPWSMESRRQGEQSAQGIKHSWHRSPHSTPRCRNVSKASEDGVTGCFSGE